MYRSSMARSGSVVARLVQFNVNIRRRSPPPQEEWKRSCVKITGAQITVSRSRSQGSYSTAHGPRSPGSVSTATLPGKSFGCTPNRCWLSMGSTPFRTGWPGLCDLVRRRRELRRGGGGTACMGLNMRAGWLGLRWEWRQRPRPAATPG
jgi:hypothetical protein